MILFPAGPQRNHRWVWFFLALLVLGTVAVVVPIVYNLGLQLRPEQLAAARARWGEKGLRDYDLAFRVKYNDDPKGVENLIEVRNGEVISWKSSAESWESRDGKVDLGSVPPPWATEPGEAPVEADWRPNVEGLFALIEKQLANDAESRGRRNYATANFDPRDGHPIHYVHRIAGTRTRQEWDIKLIPLDADGAPLTGNR
jgi:hypothetical protein